MEILFVYGTLKRGFSNHHFLEGSEFLGTGKTSSPYALYVDYLPYVIKSETVSQISGELYRVDEITFCEVDHLEGHPDFYLREKVEVVLCGRKTEVKKAWIYFYPNPKGTLISSGKFTKV